MKSSCYFYHIHFVCILLYLYKNLIWLNLACLAHDVVLNGENETDDRWQIMRIKRKAQPKSGLPYVERSKMLLPSLISTSYGTGLRFTRLLGYIPYWSASPAKPLRRNTHDCFLKPFCVSASNLIEQNRNRFEKYMFIHYIYLWHIPT